MDKKSPALLARCAAFAGIPAAHAAIHPGVCIFVDMTGHIAELSTQIVSSACTRLVEGCCALQQCRGDVGYRKVIHTQCTGGKAIAHCLQSKSNPAPEINHQLNIFQTLLSFQNLSLVLSADPARGAAGSQNRCRCCTTRSRWRCRRSRWPPTSTRPGAPTSGSRQARPRTQILAQNPNFFPNPPNPSSEPKASASRCWRWGRPQWLMANESRASAASPSV